MSERELTRRSVLKGATATGLVGAFFGGTAAVLNGRKTLGVLTDAVSFDDTLSSGRLDLRVEWNVVGGDSGTSEGSAPSPIEVTDEKRTGSATFEVSLQDDRSNPAYTWLRLCPEPSTSVDALEVTLTQGQGDVVFGPGPLNELAAFLDGGIPLDPNRAGVSRGDQECLEPDERIDLRFEWALDEDFSGEVSTSFAFQFVGQQCRHRDGTVDPFGACETGSESITVPGGDR